MLATIEYQLVRISNHQEDKPLGISMTEFVDGLIEVQIPILKVSSTSPWPGVLV